jgi:glycosyltransferase involved in cell wall biosynthesis
MTIDVTIIVATHNSASLIGLTLDSLLEQEMATIEILIIDANSKDRTLEMIQQIRDPRIRLFTVSAFNRYEMFNFGINHAHGAYLNFLTPGDIYISPKTTLEMMKLAKDACEPDLLFCGSVLRDGQNDTKILFRPLTLSLLQDGKQPTTLQAIWFKKELFAKFGKFDPSLSLRGGYDLLCRAAIDPAFTFTSVRRVFCDYDLRFVTKSMVIRHFFETAKILYRHFGLWTVIRWIFVQNDIRRFLALWKRSLHISLFGKSP